MEKNSDSGKRLKQTLQLTIRCKAGGNQASLLLELVLGFHFLCRSHCGKCQLLTDIKSLTLGNVDVTTSSLICYSLGAPPVEYSGECKMDKHGKVDCIHSDEALVFACQF